MRAYSPAPLNDPYWSALQGGYPQAYGASQENQINAEERHLGDEQLARVKLSQPVGATTFALRTDASVFLSGAALEPLLDDPSGASPHSTSPGEVNHDHLIAQLCWRDPTGWLSAEQTGGPTVVWATAVPLRSHSQRSGHTPDPDSPTGRRLNISEEATTEYERRTAAPSTSWTVGAYAPIIVSFDQPLDVADLFSRMGEMTTFETMHCSS